MNLEKLGFTHFISKASWILIMVSMAPSFVLILRPSLMEFVIFLVADGLAVVILNKIYFPIFCQKFPKSELFFYGVNHDKFIHFSKEERIELLTLMLRFPKRYAINNYVASFIKSIPAFFVMVFVWKHGVSNLMQILMVLGICTVSWVYFYGCSFYDAHTKIGEWIAELHHKFNLTEEFEALQLPERPDSLQIQEILVQIFMIIFVLALQLVVILANEFNNSFELAIKLFAIGIVGLALFTRIWYLGRKDLVGGLINIFNEMGKVDYNANLISLPLHSSPLLATFEKTFNSLTKRIAVSEQQLRNLVFQESEKSRYQVLGEISGLIAHDLSAPLHVTQYCINEIKEKNLGADAHKYIEQMGMNVTQAIELISSLRARLKNSPEAGDRADFNETHQHIIRLLGTQFSARAVQRIAINLDPRVATLNLAIPRMDLMQILDNIYRNGIRNLLENRIASPTINIWNHGQEGDRVKIVIADNGTGLSLKKFNELTDESHAMQMNSGRGLGLKLTRRLIEQYGGQLSLLESNSSGPEGGMLPSGTQFCLTLKIFNDSSKGLPSATIVKDGDHGKD